MGIVSTQQKIVKQRALRQLDLDSPEGLRNLADMSGVTVPQEQERSFTSGFLGGVGKVFDALLIGERAIGGILAGVGPMEGIRQKISPSDVILDEFNPKSGVGRFFKGVVGLGLDIGLDPLTYLTVGTGTALKLTSKTGSKVLVKKKVAKRMIDDYALGLKEKAVARDIGGQRLAMKNVGEVTEDLANEIAENALTRANLVHNDAIKKAKEMVATIADPHAGQTLLDRGGLPAISQALKSMGKPVTRENVEKILKNGLEELQAKGGIKFFGKQVVSESAAKAPFRVVSDMIQKTKVGKAMAVQMEAVGKLSGRLFSRDYGLDDLTKKRQQEFLDKFDFLRSKTAEEYNVIFNPIAKDMNARKAISHALDTKGGIEKLGRPELISLANIIKKKNKHMRDIEKNLGLLDSWIDDYVAHIYRNKSKADEFLKIYRNPSLYRQGQPSALLRFAKERRIPTLQEAKELGLDPVEDIVEIMLQREMAHHKAVLTQDFLIKTAKEAGVVKHLPVAKRLKDGKLTSKVVNKLNPKWAEAEEMLVPIGNVATGIPKELQGVHIPAHIARNIDEMDKKIISSPEMRQLLGGYDRALNFFKGSVTVVSPAFHGRNAISNVSQNFYDIGVSALNPVKHKRAVDIMSGKEGKLVTDFGEEYTYKELRGLMKTKGVLQNRVTRIDVDDVARAKAFEGRSPAALGRKLGRGVEGEARVLHFMENLKRGFDPDEAARRTKEFIFDYDNLSRFEKEFLRRTIPFYTWTRKNIALQLKTLATNPKRPLALVKTIRTLEEIMGEPDVDKEFAPDFVLEGANILLNHEQDDATFLMGFDLPFIEAFKWLNEPMKSTMNMMTPFIKAPIEGTFGYNSFRELPIKEDDSGRAFDDYPKPIKEWLEYQKFLANEGEDDEFEYSKVDPEKKWLLDQLRVVTGLSRVTSGSFIEPIISAHKILKGEEEVTNVDKWNVVRFFTGIRAFQVDPENAQRAHDNDDVEELLRILQRKGVLGVFKKPFIPKEPARDITDE